MAPEALWHGFAVGGAPQLRATRLVTRAYILPSHRETQDSADGKNGAQVADFPGAHTTPIPILSVPQPSLTITFESSATLGHRQNG
jgi:hypothetical protein